MSGGPIRNLPGVLVVSDHMSWLDVLTIGAVLPSAVGGRRPLSFVARADVAAGVAVRMMARIVKVIPIERASLRQLPEVVATVARRLYAGHTVVAFPEGTTWCGFSGQSHQGSGPFYPAMFQAAVDTGRPVQPLRLRYQHGDGQRFDRSGLHRRRHVVALDRPADGRAPHGGADLRRIAAAAGRRSAGAGPSLPGGDTRRQRCRTQVTGSARPCWRPDHRAGVGILGGSWSTWITPPPPRCTPLPSRR